MLNEIGDLVGAIAIADLALVAQNVRAGADAASVVGFHRQRGAVCGERPARINTRIAPHEGCPAHAGKSAENLALMRRMDALSLQYPFYGSRQMARHLRREGVAAGRRRVRRLLRLMGLEAIYRKPRTSDAQPDHHVYPYLLRELTIDRPDQVWCADITYIPVTTGFLYLVAIMDWASRHVLSWRLSNTMDSSFCVEALEAALQTGTPGIFNTDQGSQFTSAAFTDRVQAAGARCSMDGRGRCLDNVFIERLWPSLKYEAVYLHELADGFVAEQVISEWMTFYSDARPHSALGGRTPAEVCCRARGTDRNWTRVDRKMLWSPAASSSQQRARVLTDVKARRFAPRPRSAGLTALTPAPRTLVQIGSCRRCSLIHSLHVVVDVPSRMTLFRATADT